MRVVIGGATGFIGKHLNKQLLVRGHEVVVVSRKPGPGKITWDDLSRGGLPANTGAVINLAGQNLMDITKRWNTEFENLLRSSRINTTRQFAQLIDAAESPPKVFISASAVGYYAASASSEYTEDSAGGDGDFLSKLSHDWEQAAQIQDTERTRQVIVRIGLALGRDGGTIQNLILPFYFGLGGKIASGKQWFPWIHVDDVAGIITHAIESDHVTGVLNAVAPATDTNGDFTTAFAKALNRPACIPVPKFALDLVYGSFRAKAITEGQKVIPKRTLESGYNYKYPTLDVACKEFAHLF